MNRVILKPGREKSLLHKHPWVFSGAIQSVEGSPNAGETLPVFSTNGVFLGFGAYNPASSISVRMWNFEERRIDQDFFSEKIYKAFNFRKNLPEDLRRTNAIRLVYAEADNLPGLIVDQYDSFLVVQILTAGMEFWLKKVIDLLIDITKIQNVYERSDVDVRGLEGLGTRKGCLNGEEPTDFVEIVENEINYLVDIKEGQKTGFYLDQRNNRKRIRFFAPNQKILNCFSYTGGFTLPALRAGAKEVLSIDSSQSVIDLAKMNQEINGIEGKNSEYMCADVFIALRKLRDRGDKFDLIILDPPKFAPTVVQTQAAARGYKDINLLAFKLLNDGGRLVTFSCSGGVSLALFQKVIADAALDAGVESHIIETLSQSPDHPVSLNFPESAYLKGLVCQKG